MIDDVQNMQENMIKLLMDNEILIYDATPPCI